MEMSTYESWSQLEMQRVLDSERKRRSTTAATSTAMEVEEEEEDEEEEGNPRRGLPNFPKDTSLASLSDFNSKILQRDQFHMQINE